MPDPSPRPPAPRSGDRIAPIREPERYRTTASLKDGTRVQLRPIRPEDKDRLQAGLKRLSRDSVYKRFFEPKAELSNRELAYLTEVDFHSHVALAATLPGGEGDRLAGVGRYVLIEEASRPTAELAVTVADAHQGRGLGGLLFEHLCSMATAQGLEFFVANVLAGNLRVRRLLETHGRIVDESRDRGSLRLTVRLDPGASEPGPSE